VIGALLGAAALALSPASPGHSTAHAGDAVARVTGSEVVLRDSQIVHR
jgi:hypothetical protein